MYEAWIDVFNPGHRPEISLKVDQFGAASDQDMQVACAVLLVEMARADKAIAPEEGAAVVKLMEREFGVPSSEIPKLIEIAAAACRSGGVDLLVRCLNERLSADQRERLLAMVWKVVLADKRVDEHEEGLFEEMRKRLKLTSAQADDARYLAEKGGV